MPDGTGSVRTLINQQADASFTVLIENISAGPIHIPAETCPLSFEITEADGKTTPLTKLTADESRRGSVFHLDAGEYLAIGVTYATQEQYMSQKHHSPPPGHGWIPEFPFKRGERGRTITLRAVPEEKPADRNGDSWVGRAVSVQVEVKVVQG